MDIVVVQQTLSERFLGSCEPTAAAHALARELLTRIGDKWSIQVITTLARGPRRFTELQQDIPGISHRMLTVTLRSLATDGLVRREASGQVPPRVDYTLTAMGESLLEPLMGLVDWAVSNQPAIDESRRQARHNDSVAG